MTRSDPIALVRFVETQGPTEATALAEIRRSRKRSHRMWFVFPQLVGLGRSATAQLYGIGLLAEGCACFNHAVLDVCYMECVDTLQDRRGSDLGTVFGPSMR